MPEFSNPDTTVPLIIVGACLVLMALTWLLTRGRVKRTKQATITAANPAPTPIVGQTQVTKAQLGAWHRGHGATVKQWIENHEQVLKQVSDGGMAIDLNADLTAGHQRLGPGIDDAIANHPSPQQRAQLSALVLASRNTIDSLRRSNWTNAEQQHISYLEYRDTWLDRLRQFAATEAKANAAMPGWLDRDDTPPG